MANINYDEFFERKAKRMELLNDDEHEKLRTIRDTVAKLRNQKVSWDHCTISMWLSDVEFLLRYIGELENERWSYLG